MKITLTLQNNSDVKIEMIGTKYKIKGIQDSQALSDACHMYSVGIANALKMANPNVNTEAVQDSIVLLVKRFLKK